MTKLHQISMHVAGTCCRNSVILWRCRDMLRNSWFSTERGYSL